MVDLGQPLGSHTSMPLHRNFAGSSLFQLVVMNCRVQGDPRFSGEIRAFRSFEKFFSKACPNPVEVAEFRLSQASTNQPSPERTMKYFEDHDQLEAYLERFVTGWQAALGSSSEDQEHDV